MEHADLFILVLIVVLFYWVLTSIRRARLGKPIYVRRIPGIDAIENALGRATEMGRPILYVPGTDNDLRAIETYATLAILGYVAGFAARLRSRCIVAVAKPEVYPLAEETVREAYREAGALDQFRIEDVRYLSDRGDIFAMTVAATVSGERVASAFFLGLFSYTSLLMTEPGTLTGAIQLAGDSQVAQVPFFICTCDYVLIGEELYAASAYVSPDPTIRGGLRAQDRFKLLLLIFAVLGVVIVTLESLGISFFEEFSLVELFRRYGGAG